MIETNLQFCMHVAATCICCLPMKSDVAHVNMPYCGAKVEYQPFTLSKMWHNTDLCQCMFNHVCSNLSFISFEIILKQDKNCSSGVLSVIFLRPPATL